MRSFIEFFEESKVLTPDRGAEPIMFGDVIRVYHGFRDTRDALDAAKIGLSGKVRANRNYSYEANNNPRGLFVSTSLKDAKEFTGAYEEVNVIMEFHAPESELEIPVWPGGSFTGQGGMEQYWSNDQEKQNIQRKEAQQEKIKWILDQAERQGLDWVMESDRPDLAWFLQMGGENQALFVGDLDPNSIRAFWIREKNEKGYQSVTDPFERISRKEFIKKIESAYTPERLKRDSYDKRGWEKPFNPREEFNVEKLLDEIGDREFALDTIQGLVDSNHNMEDILGHYLWPRQMKAAKKWWDSLKRG